MPDSESNGATVEPSSPTECGAASSGQQVDAECSQPPRTASTGPRTPHGKRRSARNASKHKFLIGRVLPEEEELAAFLLKNFLRELKPRGILGLELVDDFVLNRVQRRRLDRYTVNEFEKATRRKLGGWLEMRDQRDAEFWVRHPFAQRGTESSGWERLNPKDCATILGGLRTKIRERGLSPDEDMELLSRIYGKRPTSHGALMIFIYNSGCDGPEERSEARRAERAEHQAEILKLLDLEIECQKGRAELQADLDDMELALEVRMLPQPEILDQVQRYRAANAREFTQLLADYERIRRFQEA